MKRPSVLDIAHTAGVSPSTVCRALNGKGQINVTTRDRILATSAELGYVRNAAASDLRLRRSSDIACIMPDADNELLMDKLHHLKQRARDAGYGWRMLPFRSKEEKEGVVREVIASAPAGVIVKAQLDDSELRSFEANHVPLVGYDCDIPGVDSLLLDRSRGECEAVERLIASGRKRILLLGSPLSNERGEGYASAHKKAHVRVIPSLVVSEPFGRDLYSYGYEHVSHSIGVLEYDAVAAVNDACAIGAMRALHEAGKQVPNDVAVVGFDDIAASRYATPSLSTIAQPIEEMASAAVSALVERIANPRGRRKLVRLETRFIPRESA